MNTKVPKIARTLLIGFLLALFNITFSCDNGDIKIVKLEQKQQKARTKMVIVMENGLTGTTAAISLVRKNMRMAKSREYLQNGKRDTKSLLKTIRMEGYTANRSFGIRMDKSSKKPSTWMAKNTANGLPGILMDKKNLSRNTLTMKNTAPGFNGIKTEK